MLLSVVSVLVVAQSSSEIPEGLMNNSVYYHTYQLKEEGAYRIVIKYLRHSTDVNEIRQELFDLGHDFRNIVNAHHRITKEPLNLFFPDLEPAANKKMYTT